jgi:hypothetical protein
MTPKHKLSKVYIEKKFSYKTLDAFGDVIHTAESDALKINIESSKFPKSPFQAGSYLPGQPVEFVIEFEQFPDPDPENVVWVVKGNDDKEQEFTPGQQLLISLSFKI